MPWAFQLATTIFTARYLQLICDLKKHWKKLVRQVCSGTAFWAVRLAFNFMPPMGLAPTYVVKKLLCWSLWKAKKANLDLNPHFPQALGFTGSPRRSTTLKRSQRFHGLFATVGRLILSVGNQTTAEPKFIRFPVMSSGPVIMKCRWGRVLPRCLNWLAV